MINYKRKIVNGMVRSNIEYNVDDFEFIKWYHQNFGVTETHFIRMAIKEKIESLYKKEENLKAQAIKKGKDLNKLI